MNFLIAKQMNVTVFQNVVNFPTQSMERRVGHDPKNSNQIGPIFSCCIHFFKTGFKYVYI